MSTSAQIKGGKLVVQNTLFVAKNGNDETAVKNRWDKPFLTIFAATTASNASETIYVFPGLYNEGTNDITKSDVNYFYELGSHVQCTDEVISDFNIAKNINVAGAGVFETLGINFVKACVWTQNPSTNINIEFHKAIGRTNGIAIRDCTTFNIKVDDVTTDLQYPIYLRGNIAGSLEFGSLNVGNAAPLVLSNIGTDLVSRDIYIKGREMNSELVGFAGGVISSFACFNTRFLFRDFVINHTNAVAGGCISLSGNGLYYFKNVTFLSEFGYGVNLSSSIALLENCNVVSSRLALRTQSTTNAEVVNCNLKSDDAGDANNGTIEMFSTSELDIRDSVVQQTSGDALPTVVFVNNSNLRMSNTLLIGSALMTESIRSLIAQNIRIELDCSSNLPANPLITNIVAGTTMVVDANITRNFQTFF